MTFTHAKAQRSHPAAAAKSALAEVARNSNKKKDRKPKHLSEKQPPDNRMFFLCACALKRYGAQARSWRALRETAFPRLKSVLTSACFYVVQRPAGQNLPAFSFRHLQQGYDLPPLNNGR